MFVIIYIEYLVAFMTRLTYNVTKGGVAMLNFELVAKRFSELRNKSGFTQSIVAEYLDVDQSYISKCEKCERQFSVDILDKAAELFGCTMDYFVNESVNFTDANSFRAKSVTVEDLNTIAMNKIALNPRFGRFT